MPNHVTLNKQLFELNGEFELQFIIPHHGYVIIAFYCKTRKGGGTREEASIVGLFVMTTLRLFNEVYHKHCVWRHWEEGRRRGARFTLGHIA